MAPPEKDKVIFMSMGEYPRSYYTTPNKVKEYMYELQYQLLSVQQEDPKAETFTEGWSEEDLRSLATSLVQAKLGWGKPGVTLRVSKSDAKRVREVRKYLAKMGIEEDGGGILAPELNSDRTTEGL